MTDAWITDRDLLDAQSHFVSMIPGFERASAFLSPAEAATHIEHPNLWSWRELLNSANSDSDFLACFVANVQDAHVSGEDTIFRQYIY